MKYKMNLGGSALIVDIPHPLSVLRDLDNLRELDQMFSQMVDQMFSRAQTAESAAHRQTAKRAPQPVIVITSDGVTTTATRRIGKTIQAIATAKCNPCDSFDFDEGARIAFERLCGRDPFPGKPEAYNGRMICVKSQCPWWTVGKIYEVVDGRITADNGGVYPPRDRAPYRDAEDAKHAGNAGWFEGDPRHNRRNLFLPVDAEGRLLV